MTGVSVDRFETSASTSVSESAYGFLPQSVVSCANVLSNIIFTTITDSGEFYLEGHPFVLCAGKRAR